MVGELKALRLTRTGFIQNFFDNPKLRLERVETATGELRLLADYVMAKSSAIKALESVPQDSVPPCPAQATHNQKDTRYHPATPHQAEQ